MADKKRKTEAEKELERYQDMYASLNARYHELTDAIYTILQHVDVPYHDHDEDE